MATDYILFVHGVNTREAREQPTYADPLFDRLQASTLDSDRHLKKLAFYWGDLNMESENFLLAQMQASPLWERLWFRSFRSRQIIQFAGDAVLYISRHIGSRVVNKLKSDTLNAIADFEPGDRLHVITHSWGTVMLFDILFAARWDDPDVPGHQEVMAIRDAIFGVSGIGSDTSEQGIELASIHTMGSPIAIFSLTDIIPGKDGTSSPSGHDITPCLQKLLEHLHVARQGQKLPWRNYIHPADPLAYPLKQLMSGLVDGDAKYLDIQDIDTREIGRFDFLTQPLNQTVLALIHGGNAHASYWQNRRVVQEICNVIFAGNDN
jgi:hypothetical protein